MNLSSDALPLVRCRDCNSSLLQPLRADRIDDDSSFVTRACPDCGNRCSLKGHHPILFRTPFGTLRLTSKRVRVCPCTQKSTGWVSPLAELLGERVSPEMLYLETKFASLVSYGLTVRLMGEVLPLDRPIPAERVRRHLFRVAEAHEAQLASALTSITGDKRAGPNNALPDGPLYVGRDGGYVRGREQSWFEAIAGKSLVSFHRDGRVPDPSGRCFAFVQTMDDKPRARLVDTLRQQEMQPQQQVVFLSDGADALCFRPEPAFSTATSINSSVVDTQRSGNRQASGGRWS